MSGRFITRNKNSKPKPAPTYQDQYSIYNGEILIKSIHDYPIEDQERWNRIGPARNRDGELLRKPVVK